MEKNWVDPQHYAFKVDFNGHLPVTNYGSTAAELNETDADVTWTITGWGQTVLCGSHTYDHNSGIVTLTVRNDGEYRKFPADIAVNPQESFTGQMKTELKAYTYQVAHQANNTYPATPALPSAGTLLTAVLHEIDWNATEGLMFGFWGGKANVNGTQHFQPIYVPKSYFSSKDELKVRARFQLTSADGTVINSNWGATSSIYKTLVPNVHIELKDVTSNGTHRFGASFTNFIEGSTISLQKTSTDDPTQLITASPLLQENFDENGVEKSLKHRQIETSIVPGKFEDMLLHPINPIWGSILEPTYTVKVLVEDRNGTMTADGSAIYEHEATASILFDKNFVPPALGAAHVLEPMPEKRNFKLSFSSRHTPNNNTITGIHVTIKSRDPLATQTEVERRRRKILGMPELLERTVVDKVIPFDQAADSLLSNEEFQSEIHELIASEELYAAEYQATASPIFENSFNGNTQFQSTYHKFLVKGGTMSIINGIRYAKVPKIMSAKLLPDKVSLADAGLPSFDTMMHVDRFDASNLTSVHVIEVKVNTGGEFAEQGIFEYADLQTNGVAKRAVGYPVYNPFGANPGYSGAVYFIGFGGMKTNPQLMSGGGHISELSDPYNSHGVNTIGADGTPLLGMEDEMAVHTISRQDNPLNMYTAWSNLFEHTTKIYMWLKPTNLAGPFDGMIMYAGRNQTVVNTIEINDQAEINLLNAQAAALVSSTYDKAVSGLENLQTIKEEQQEVVDDKKAERDAVQMSYDGAVLQLDSAKATEASIRAQYANATNSLVVALSLIHI